VTLIIVNGHEHEHEGEYVTYEQAVALALMSTRKDYTVTYRTRVSAGSLRPMLSCWVTDGAVFNVAHTGAA
jgi:hypothetical protein